jgi:hypothetical protein
MLKIPCAVRVRFVRYYGEEHVRMTRRDCGVVRQFFQLDLARFQYKDERDLDRLPVPPCLCPPIPEPWEMI